MESKDTNKNKICKFLGVDQVNVIRTKVVFKRVKSEVEKRVKMLMKTKLTNLISTINFNIILVATYSMNFSKFNKGELKELDKIIKRKLRSREMLGKPTSKERLYLNK